MPCLTTTPFFQNVGTPVSLLISVNQIAMLSDKQITTYQELYRKRFGKEISRADALGQGTKLVRMMQLIYKPMTEAEYQLLENRRKETRNE